MMQLPPSMGYLLEAARWAPSADNSQPWRLCWGISTLTVEYDEARVGRTTFSADDPATLLSIGALLENISQAARAVDVDIAVQWSKSAPPGYLRLDLGDGMLTREGPRDHPLFERHTNRLAFRTDPLPNRLADELRGQREGDAGLVVLEDTLAMAGIARLVRNASEIRFRTREITEWLARSLRFAQQGADLADGLDVATLNLPPGGSGLLRTISDWRRMERLNRWGAYKLLAAVEAKSVTNASVIVAVTGAGGHEGAVDAGRLMERAWILLNQRGLAVHPYYVISDQLFRHERKVLPAGLERNGEALADETDSVLRLSGSGKRLYMLLRVGYPKREPVRSKRLPLTAISESETDPAQARERE